VIHGAGVSARGSCAHRSRDRYRVTSPAARAPRPTTTTSQSTNAVVATNCARAGLRRSSTNTSRSQRRSWTREAGQRGCSTRCASRPVQRAASVHRVHRAPSRRRRPSRRSPPLPHPVHTTEAASVTAEEELVAVVVVMNRDPLRPTALSRGPSNHAPVTQTGGQAVARANRSADERASGTAPAHGTKSRNSDSSASNFRLLRGPDAADREPDTGALVTAPNDPRVNAARQTVTDAQLPPANVTVAAHGSRPNDGSGAAPRCTPAN
jgi:hypothetical protein